MNYEINEDYFTSKNFVKPRPKGTSPNLLEKQKAENFGYLKLIYNFCIFWTFSIGSSQFFLFYLTMKFGFVEVAATIGVLCFSSIFYSEALSNILAKTKAISFCIFLNDNFGSLASHAYEICCLFWIEQYFYFAFFTIKVFVDQTYEEKLWPYVSFISAYVIAFFLFNTIYFKHFNTVKLLINLFLNIAILVILALSTWFCFKFNLNKNEFYKKFSHYTLHPFNVISSSFNVFISLYNVNTRLKKSNFSLNKINFIFALATFFHLGYIFIFAIQPMVIRREGPFESEEFYIKNFFSYSTSFSDFKTKALAYGLVGCYVASNIVSSSFHLRVMRDKIFGVEFNKTIRGWTFGLLVLTLIGVGALLGVFVKSPINFITFLNATFGFAINFLFPSLVIIKHKIRCKELFLLLLVFVLYALMLSSGYSFFLKVN